MNNIGIYIHIPFCKTRCGYCDFLTFDCGSEHYSPYKNALVKEMQAYKALKDYRITSIFIGGGTPTILPPNFIKEILSAVGKYNIAANAEITVESNPGTLSPDMLRTLKNSGVNRLSMGLQAWQNPLLKKIGRNHKLQDFLKNYNHARRLGFKNINVDLIFSLPYINSEKAAFKYWVETLRNVAELSPEHISVYSLIIEENTPFFEEYEKGNLIPQSQESDRRMYNFAINYLSKKGYTHYEISNFAKEGKDCKHNMNYWQRGEYISFGLGASSFVNGQRTRNITDIKKYIKVLNDPNYEPTQMIEESVEITLKDAMSEFMYLGLRCTEGISPKEFERSFGTPLHRVFGEYIQKNIANGLLYHKNGKIALTKQGINISNRVMSDFLLV